MCCLAIIGLIADVAVTAASYVYLDPTCCYYTTTNDDHAIFIYPPSFSSKPCLVLMFHRVMLPNLTSRYLERFAICGKLNCLSR
jgi:hypothetical protein